mgnify:CR=1 FL=1
MSGAGRFLEFGVRAPDILESLGFYKLLGFTELETGDVYDHKYAVVSDGDVSIGLHDCEMDSPQITFVHPELAKHARSMSDHGFDFERLVLEEDLFNQLELKDRDAEIARDILPELQTRLRFLADVGLSYLTLDRAAPTLSGGEAQRIRLATQIGSQLTGVLYVLDEPSVGLHAADVHKLIEVLQRLVDEGNTVLIIEHKMKVVMTLSDRIVVLERGRVIEQGSHTELLAAGGRYRELYELQFKNGGGPGHG